MELAQCRLQTGTEAGLEAVGGGLLLDQCTVEGPGVGVRVQGAPSQVLDTTFVNLAGGGLEVGGGQEARLTRCVFRTCAFAGVIALEEARVLGTGCTFEGCEDAGMHLHHGAQARLGECTFQAGPAYGLSIQKGAQAHLEGCTLKGHAVAPVLLGRDATAPELSGCTLEGGILREEAATA